MLTRDQILSAESVLPHEEVSVPEWGGNVLVWGMTGSERDAFEESRQKADPSAAAGKPKTKTDLSNIRAALCVWCIRDDAGKRLFTNEDIVALGRKSAKALTRVADVAMRLNGMTPEDAEALEKN